MVAVITWPEVAARRLARHGLTEPHPAVAVAAGAMCGVHAQIMSAAELSLGLRVAGTTRSDVADALWRDHTLVKTFGPRGTVHLLPADRFAQWTAALAAVPRTNNMPVGVRLDHTQQDAVIAAIGDALEHDELDIEQLGDAVVARCGDWASELVMPAFGGMWPRWRQAIGAAATAGALCFGPNRGRRVTYASPHEFLTEQVSERDAVRGLVHDYLHAYGPATSDHFARWLATSPSWARAAFADSELDEILLDGERTWANHGDNEFPGPARGVHLLPYFDAFAVGSHPRSALFPGRAAERALAGSQAGNFPVLLVDGVVAGVWHPKRSGRRVAIVVEPLRALSAARQRKLAAAIESVAHALEAVAEWTIGTVTVGPHA